MEVPMALPGVKTTILDRFYNLGRTDLPGGPVIALIAKRDINPVGGPGDLVPYAPTGEQIVIQQFGEGSYIHRAYKEALIFGATRLVLIPLPKDTVFTHGTASVTSASYGGDIFDAIFAAAESVRPDIIVPWGAGSDPTWWDDPGNGATPATPGHSDENYFYADNSIGASWAKKVSDKCAEITSNSYPCFAVIGTRPMVGLETLTSAQLTTGVAMPNLMNRETNKLGHFVSVVASEVRPLSYPSSWGWSNGAVAYAAAAARYDPWRATTGKPLFNVDAIRYNPTRPQQEVLANKGVVSAAIDFSGTVKWVDGTTFAPANSDFVRLTTLRISFDVVKLILGVAENYKGEGMSYEQQSALDTQIGSRLRAMQVQGALNNSDYRVTFLGSQNQAVIDIAITPAFELREIILTLSINF